MSQSTNMPAPSSDAVPPSLSVEDMTDIIDIKGPAPLPVDWTAVWWIAGLLALLGLALLAWMWFKRRRRRDGNVPAVPPHVRAEQALSALEDETGARPFYFRLSAVLRRYIEETTSVRAMEMTTEELGPHLDVLPVDDAVRRGLKALFRGADPVKFAGLDATRDAMRRDLELAGRFVSATRPQEKDGDGGRARKGKKGV